MKIPDAATNVARSRRLAAVRGEIQALTVKRLARPGGLADGIMRDRIEDLQDEENALCRDLGLPLRHPEPRGAGCLGWTVLGVVASIIVSVLYLVN